MALWSQRPTRWRDHRGDGPPTGALDRPFDLVAPGGAENLWVVEVGHIGDPADGEVTVTHHSPGAGRLEVGPGAAILVDGRPAEPTPASASTTPS